MRLELFTLLQAYASAISDEELAADQLAEASRSLRAKGDIDNADAITEIASQHRVKALEMSGRLAALCERYHRVLHPHRVE